MAGEDRKVRPVSESSPELSEDEDDEALRMSGAVKESILVVDSSSTGAEIWVRWMAFPGCLTLKDRCGSGREISGLLLRFDVNARARAMAKKARVGVVADESVGTRDWSEDGRESKSRTQTLDRVD